MQATVDISKAQSIIGWMSDRELLWLAEMASKSKIIVEFGCFHGRSTRSLADNISEDGKIYAVDPWNGDYVTESGVVMGQVDTYCMPNFKYNLADHIKAGRVIPVRNFSYNFKLPIESELADMVFIDGDHRYDTVLKDIDIAQKITKPGGIIAGHDYGHSLWTGVKKAAHEKFASIEIEDTIWWTKLDF